MTKVILLEQLKKFTEQRTKDLFLPVAPQKEDREPPKDRPAEVHSPRLPDSHAAKKKAPYILHQVIAGKDGQSAGKAPASSVTIRTIFCVYHPNEEEGGLALLNLMERVRIGMLEAGVIGKQFCLDMEAGLESLVYPDDSAPYYAGEMISVWKLPIIERKVPYAQEHNWNGAGLR